MVKPPQIVSSQPTKTFNSSDIPSKKVNLNAEWPSHGIWVVGEEKEESIWAICAMYTGLINLSLEYLKTR